uniref:Uncharacterized protein LOC114328740 n=1 Tax=Diabrotica virgifera virgifera TaxID=50390 RepID=A0A6P7FF42_DIAVI
MCLISCCTVATISLRKMADEVLECVTVASKKRVLNTLKWKKTIRKDSKNRGLTYINTKNNEVGEKTEPKEVSCKCQFSCTCITLDCRKKLFRNFWDIGNYNEQQIYLKNFIRVCLVNRRRHGSYDDATQSRRQRTYKYILIIRGMSEVQVCKKTFCEPFGVSGRRVQILAEKIGCDDESLKDKRGGKRQRREPEWKEKIINYISSIPAQESHYGRSDAPNRKYLPTELNVPSRVDTCPTCDSLKVQIDTAPTEEIKTDGKQKLEIHHRQAELARQQMSKDDIKSRENNSGIRMVQFDLQQQMYLPTHT